MSLVLASVQYTMAVWRGMDAMSPSRHADPAAETKGGKRVTQQAFFPGIAGQN